MQTILQIIEGFLIANYLDWAIHKYVLHGLGKNPSSWFHYHFEHHYICNKNNGKDLFTYNKNPIKKTHLKELFSLCLGSFLLYTLFHYMGFSVLGSVVLLYAVLYYVLHRLAHKNVGLLPWHADHHITQTGNWCVVVPAFDLLAGTRKVITRGKS